MTAQPADLRDPLRILQVVNVRWFNATAWYGLFLSRLLRDAGHSVRVICLGGTETFAKAVEWGLNPESLPLNRADPFTVARMFAKLSSRVREFSPHIVNCHRGEALILWGLLKAAGHSFALVRTRGDQRRPKNNCINRWLHGKVVDAVIAVNSRAAADMRCLGVAPARLHTIVGGVDNTGFYPDPEGRSAMRAAWGIGAAEKVIGLLGRFDAVKGHKVLLDAVAYLCREQEGMPLRLVLAGFPTDMAGLDAVEGWIQTAGLEGRALLTGRVANVRACIAAFDVGVVASIGSEAIARAALEIMACGVPLLGTRVGVMPDLLDEDALAAPGDASALAALLRRFFTDASYAAKLEEEQRLRISSLSARNFLEQTLAVYCTALHGAGPSSPP